MGDNGMMMVVMLGGGVFLCSLCAGGLFLLYQTNPDMFGLGEDTGAKGISTSAGKYLCPQPITIDGTTYRFKTNSLGTDHKSKTDGVQGFERVWCESPGYHTNLASKMPPGMLAGTTINAGQVENRGGIYGPAIAGHNPLVDYKDDAARQFKYKGASTTRAPK